MNQKQLREEILTETGLDLDKMSDEQKREMIKKHSQNVENLEKSQTKRKLINAGALAAFLVLLYLLLT